jgi:hypothetical protein
VFWVSGGVGVRLEFFGSAVFETSALLIDKDKDIFLSAEGDSAGDISVALDLRRLTSLLSPSLFLFTNISGRFLFPLALLGGGGGGGGAISCICKGLTLPWLCALRLVHPHQQR